VAEYIFKKTHMLSTKKLISLLRICVYWKLRE
jgi:hypothetical protein